MLRRDFSAGLIWPHANQDEPRALAKSEYEALLRACSHHPRDHAMFELLLQTGIRLSELTSLTLESITLPARPSAHTETGYGELRVRRKGGRLQELVLNYKTCRTLASYLRVRPAPDTPALFLTKYAEAIGNHSVQKAFKKYAREAGVSWAHVHTLRTTHITQHLAAGTDIRTVQHNAGHASLATTNRYAAYVKDAAIQAMQKHAL